MCSANCHSPFAAAAADLPPTPLIVFEMTEPKNAEKCHLRNPNTRVFPGFGIPQTAFFGIFWLSHFKNTPPGARQDKTTKNMLFDLTLDPEPPSQLTPGGLQNLLFELTLDPKPPSQLAPGEAPKYSF